MFKTLDDICIDRLKENHVRLYYFGLGFIQLKLNETWRLHFYSSELPAITEDIHNHRYDFTSRILKGQITNRLFQVDPGDTHYLVNESCNPDISAPPEKREVTAGNYSVETYSEGESYRMLSDWYHTVEAKNCITLLERGGYKAEFAQVVLPKDKESVCPFSKKIPEKQLWEIIRAMLQ